MVVRSRIDAIPPFPADVVRVSRPCQRRSTNRAPRPIGTIMIDTTRSSLLYLPGPKLFSTRSLGLRRPRNLLSICAISAC
jgi:hypothetical protein